MDTLIILKVYLMITFREDFCVIMQYGNNFFIVNEMLVCEDGSGGFVI